MQLREVLAPERAIVPLMASSFDAAAAQLLACTTTAHGVLDARRLRERVAEGRPDDVVAMGGRAFLLHYRTEAVGKLVVSIGVAPEPIRRESGEPPTVEEARILLFIAMPPRHAARYLQVVGAFARLLRRPEDLSAILGAHDATALLALPELASVELPEQLSVRDVMSDHPRTIRPDATLREAARVLVRAGVGALPVVDDDQRVMGMVS